MGDGAHYYDKCLPPGCSSLCQIFEAFFTALKWILTTKKKVYGIVKVLDDFLFVENTKSKCQLHLDMFLLLCSELDVPLAPGKTVLPCNEIVFSGIELDSLIMVARLPCDKLATYSKDISDIVTNNKITLCELKLIIGKLQFGTSVIRPGRASFKTPP